MGAFDYGAKMDRFGYIEVGPGTAVAFDPHAVPYIRWGHIDGPVLHLRNASMHWLTLSERFLVWVGWHDARSLERKHAAEFVERWEERLKPVPNPFMGQE